MNKLKFLLDWIPVILRMVLSWILFGYGLVSFATSFNVEDFPDCVAIMGVSSFLLLIFTTSDFLSLVAKELCIAQKKATGKQSQ